MLTNSSAFASLSFLSPRLVTWLDIDLRNFKKNPPILVYQMGKVGSQSVFHALRDSNLGYPIYHLHSLHREPGASNYHRYLSGQQQCNYAIGDALYNNLDTASHWYIITGTRDPIAREISAVFQNMKHTLSEIDVKPGVTSQADVFDAVYELMLKRITATMPATLNWFESEFKMATGIDIYQYPFDGHKGYGIIHQENKSVLIIRQENLAEAFHPGIRDLFERDLSHIDLPRRNDAARKAYSAYYEHVRASFTAARELLQPIYEHKYCRHFYPDMRYQFLDRWSS
jgi:hypothetical protein